MHFTVSQLRTPPSTADLHGPQLSGRPQLSRVCFLCTVAYACQDMRPIFRVIVQHWHSHRWHDLGSEKLSIVSSRTRLKQYACAGAYIAVEAPGIRGPKAELRLPAELYMLLDLAASNTAGPGPGRHGRKPGSKCRNIMAQSDPTCLQSPTPFKARRQECTTLKTSRKSSQKSSSLRQGVLFLFPIGNWTDHGIV